MSRKYATFLVFECLIVMPHYCIAFGCRNQQDQCFYGFHRFPRDESRQSRWEAAVRREGWLATDYSRICGAYFVTGKLEI